MARTDRVFSRLKLNYRTPIPKFYVDHLFESKAGFEGTPHIFWSNRYNEWGYPAHKMLGRVMPLNGYLLYKNDNWALAGDEAIVTTCGVRNCCQTAHMRIVPKSALIREEIK